MVKAKDLSDSVDGKYSKEDAIEEADRSKKTSIKVVSDFLLSCEERNILLQCPPLNRIT